MDAFELTLDTLRDSFQRIGLNVTHLSDQRALVVHRSNEPELPLRVITDDGSQVVAFAVVGNFKIPKDRFVDTCCGVAMANGMIHIGSWCFNHAESEVYYRLTLPCDNVLWNDQSVRWLAEIALGHSKIHLEKFRDIALNGASFDCILVPDI